MSIQATKSVGKTFLTLGLVMIGLGIVYLWYIVDQLHQANKGPDPPGDIILIHDVPFCGCDMTAIFLWNLIAVLISLGLVFAFAGYGVYRFKTRKGIY